MVALSAGEPNGALDAAGRRMDELIAAERRGDYGVMTVFKPQKG
jgi:hypothetical protein